MFPLHWAAAINEKLVSFCFFDFLVSCVCYFIQNIHNFSRINRTMLCILNVIHLFFCQNHAQNLFLVQCIFISSSSFLICRAYGRKYNKHPFSFSFIICFGSFLIFLVCILFESHRSRMCLLLKWISTSSKYLCIFSWYLCWCVLHK